jgi:hypothetical protein
VSHQAGTRLVRVAIRGRVAPNGRRPDPYTFLATPAGLNRDFYLKE